MAQNAQSFILHSEIYGDLQIQEEQVYKFEKGIIGLQDIRRYALIHLENSPFAILHALDEQISFILIPAADAVRDYAFHIDDETTELLKVERPEEVVTMLVVNIIDDRLYVNLKAPILLSPLHQAGVQFVIHNQDFPIRYPLPSARKEGVTDAGS
jgi:flagellar assembly factor FliW